MTVLPPAVALMGPTASGKTQLAIELALALNGEVISVDSGLVYRGMDIGSAKPTLEERQGVPHHLIDILDPAETYSTGRFREQALELIGAIHSRGRLPILAGGTMLYFNALFHGLAALPPADPELRRQIDREAELKGWHQLHQELAVIDAAAASRIHPNDPQRIQRALEVYRLTGVSITELCARAESAPPPCHFIRMVVSPGDRELLHRRIRQRFLAMLEQGLVEEVERLYRRGDLDASMPSVRAVGYRQVWFYLQGEWDYPTMTEKAITATRQFAKRQYTWLRRETDAPHYDSDSPRLLAAVQDNLRKTLDALSAA
ncbi:MAG: tRNA (adenosine(37)-N6)-dimethylallyltransferase MiaA [Methylococcaceae bacterium]|nr:tRNA (adenosine(37)-N6)-dimethylallyltransferase MiaA [Methylococcaceae bacterium]